MREIKFRACHRKGRLMCKVIAMDWYKDTTILKKRGFDAYEVKNEDIILMQYINLKDKNGRKAFENDLISHCDRNSGKPIEIIWSNGGWVGRYVSSGFGCELNSYEMGKSTIVGNRYENPEMVEDK